MTVIGLQDFLSAAIARQVKPATLRASAAVPTPAPVASATESASLSSISSQSAGTASYASTSTSLAQLGTVLQVSQYGVADVQSILQQLEALAGQANNTPDVSTATLAKINSQFQQLLAQLGRISADTTFDGAPLLDGSFSGQQLANPGNTLQSAPKIALPNITQNALFGAAQPNLLSPEAATQALNLVGNAKTTTSKASSDLKEAQDQVEYISAHVQSAITNIDAAGATLTAEDVSGALDNFFSGLLAEPAAAASVQTANLNPSLLSLLQE